jgi:hypothetical protein
MVVLPARQCWNFRANYGGLGTELSYRPTSLGSPGGPVRKPYSYSVPSSHKLFENSSTGYVGWRNRFLGIDSSLYVKGAHKTKNSKDRTISNLKTSGVLFKGTVAWDGFFSLNHPIWYSKYESKFFFKFVLLFTEIFTLLYLLAY